MPPTSPRRSITWWRGARLPTSGRRGIRPISRPYRCACTDLVGDPMTARILIVEDHDPLTLLLRYNLEAEGYTVDTAVRGDDAEIKISESQPDLVVLDWMLPGLSGIELCRRLRARPAT